MAVAAPRRCCGRSSRGTGARSRGRGAGAGRRGRPGRGARSTVPACGAVIDSSIFIDSRTSRTSPAATGSPSATRTSSTVPGIGASSEPGRGAPRPARERRCAPRARGRRGRPDVVAVDGERVAPRDPVEPIAARRPPVERRARRPACARPRAPRRRTATSPCPSSARRQAAASAAARVPAAAARAAAGSRSSGGGVVELGQHALEQPGVHARPRGRRSRASSARVNAALVGTPSTLELGQRAVEAPQRGRAVGPVGDDLGEHRVVGRRDLDARADAGVDAHARAGRLAVARATGPSRAGSRRRDPRRRAAPRPRGRAARASSWRERSGSPAATRSCCSTRSTPVTSSVTGCSTCSRAFISRKKKLAGVGVGDELDGAGARVAGRRARARPPPRPARRAAPRRRRARAPPR